MIARILLFFAAFTAPLLAQQQPAFQPRAWFLPDRDLAATLVSADKTNASLKSADGKALSVPVSSLDGHSLRYLQGVEMAKGREFSDWHFDKLPKELADFPATVRAAFLRVVCEDHEIGRAHV